MLDECDPKSPKKRNSRENGITVPDLSEDQNRSGKKREIPTEYKELFTAFLKHFLNEADKLGDEGLMKLVENAEQIVGYKPKAEEIPIEVAGRGTGKRPAFIPM